MKLVLATPLYPPDIAAPAPYVKELARRLSQEHEVTIVTYGRLPEEVPGVRIIAVDKRQPLIIRLLSFTIALMRAVRGADVLYVENGASTELPAGIVARLSRARFILHIGDAAAHHHAHTSKLYGAIERFASERAARIVRESPDLRPEILPLEPTPEQALIEYEQSWQEHLAMLATLFSHE
jgi:hypothetical protein